MHHHRGIVIVEPVAIGHLLRVTCLLDEVSRHRCAPHIHGVGIAHLDVQRVQAVAEVRHIHIRLPRVARGHRHTARGHIIVQPLDVFVACLPLRYRTYAKQTEA